MRKKKHWSEKLQCSCGKVFSSLSAEATHRHNFPALCKPKKVSKLTSSNKKDQGK